METPPLYNTPPGSDASTIDSTACGADDLERECHLPTRVYRIVLPRGLAYPRFPFLARCCLVLLSLVLLVSLAVLLGMLWGALGEWGVGDATSFAVALAGLVVSTVGIAWLSRLPHRWAGLDRNRRRRLKRLVAARDALSRFPHRLVERRLRGDLLIPERIEDALRPLPPGTVIIANKRPDLPLPLADGCAATFEPADVFSDRARLWALAQADGALRESLARLTGDSSGRILFRRSGRIRILPYAMKRWSNMLISFAGVFLLLLSRASGRGGLLAVFLLMLGFAWAIVQERFRFRRCRWVQGALILRGPSAKRTPPITLITRASTPLLIDLRAGRAYVLVQDRVLTVPCPDWTALCLLSAWLSPNPPPTPSDRGDRLTMRERVSYD